MMVVSRLKGIVLYFQLLSKYLLNLIYKETCIRGFNMIKNPPSLSHALINMWFGGNPSKAVTVSLPVFHLARSSWRRVHKRPRGMDALRWPGLASELQATYFFGRGANKFTERRS